MYRFNKDLSAISGVLFGLLTVAGIAGAIVASPVWIAPAIMTGTLSALCIAEAINDED